MRAQGWRTVRFEGWEILVGKGARDNDELTFGEARPRDLWLHASGYAGSHVVVRVPEGAGEVPGAVVQRAAELAAYHSKARTARRKVAVHLCRARDVRKPRRAPPGQVQLETYRTLKVYPREGPASVADAGECG